MELPNKNLKFSRFVWEDGSEALADSRGLLHLKSGDSSHSGNYPRNGPG